MKSDRLPRAKALLLLCVFPVILAACGGGDSNSSTPQVSAANSTITAAPTSVTADGQATAAITVALKDTGGNPYTGSADVTIQADPCTNCTLSYENDNGKVTGTIKSTAAEDITLSFTVNGTASPSTELVHFVPGPPDAEQSKIMTVAPGTAAWADGYSSKQVIVSLYDRFGNRITAGDYANEINFFQVPPASSAGAAATILTSPQPKEIWDWPEDVCFYVDGCTEESPTQALGDGQYGASVTVVAVPHPQLDPPGRYATSVTMIGGAQSEAIYAGSPGAPAADGKPLPYMPATIGFSVGGVVSPNTAEIPEDLLSFFCFIFPNDPWCLPGSAAQARSPLYTAPAPLTLMQAWTVETCSAGGACADHGLYVASATDPSVPATRAVPGDLTVPAGGHPVLVVERTAFGPQDGILYQAGAGAAIYAQGGKLWRLDLTHGLSAPTQLSTLEFTALCSLTPISPYNVVFDGTESVGAPTSVIVSGFDTQGKTTADCASEPAKRWLVTSNGGMNPPITLAADQFYLMSLADPQSGAALGLLFQKGADLVLYRPNFTQSFVLARDLVPAGSRALAMNYRGMHKAAVIDIPVIGGGQRTDTFYRVGADALGTIRLASLSAYTSDSYFSHCVNGAADFQPSAVVGTSGMVYFDYPSSSGFSVYRLGALSGRLTAIYNESAAWCNVPGVWSTKNGYYAFVESNTGSGGSRFISVSQSRLAGQTPIVLASVDQSGSLLAPYYSVGADRLWIEKGECSDASCTQHSTSVTAASPAGTASQVFADALLAGDAQQGITTVAGNVLRAYVAMVQAPNGPCSPTAWALYDPATLAPVYQPDFGAGACANRALLIYGPNETMLTGNVPDASGGGTSVYSLYYPLGAQYDPPTSLVLKQLGHYALPAGAASIEVVPIF
ncbi:MAG: Ig-like domain-containing protein [Gammaproteobacteria bacterium]